MERAENNHKQVIVIRKDLNMRKGKMVAQGAHASMAAILGLARRPSKLHIFAPYVVAAALWIAATFLKPSVECFHSPCPQPEGVWWEVYPFVFGVSYLFALLWLRVQVAGLVIPFDERVEPWLTGRFKKICVSVNSEQELLDLYERARAAGVVCALIKDAGLTEFKEPTYTAVAIGPDREDVVDRFTKDLPLL